MAGIARAKVAKAIFWASFLLLNVFFAWTSRLLRTISPALFSWVSGPIQWQQAQLWEYFDLVRYSPYTYIVTDVECLVLLVVLVTSSAWLNRARGAGAALLRSIQVAGVCLVIFEVELGLLDCSEFFIHVTDLQLVFKLVPGFTNADLLFASAAVLVATTLLLNLSRIETEWSRATASTPVADRPPAVASGRRDVGRLLILLICGAVLLVGGGALAYYEGVWRLSYSIGSGIGGDGVASIHSTLTNYSGCRSQLRLFAEVSSNPSCSLASFDTGDLGFVGLGGASMLGGFFVLARKHPTVVGGGGGGIDRWWWVIAAVVPLLGLVMGYSMLDRGGGKKETGTTLMILGVESLFVFALLLVSFTLVWPDVMRACSPPLFVYVP